MAVGLRFEQRLRGTFYRLSDPGREHPVELHVRVALPLRRIVRGTEGELRGRIVAEGYADAPVRGTYRIDLGSRKIVYDFVFEADDGRDRRFHGETVFDITRPVRAIEDLVGRIYDDDREDARVLLSVPFETGAWQMLRSLRAHLRRDL